MHKLSSSFTSLYHYQAFLIKTLASVLILDLLLSAPRALDLLLSVLIAIALDLGLSSAPAALLLAVTAVLGIGELADDFGEEVELLVGFDGSFEVSGGDALGVVLASDGGGFRAEGDHEEFEGF